jgi:Trk K+ transport system NAD-binding subunit
MSSVNTPSDDGTDSEDTPADASADDLGADGTPPASSRVVVLGGGQLGRRLAGQLASEGPVHYLDDDVRAVERAARTHEATYVSSLIDRRTLASVLTERDLVLVATTSDSTNLLAAQLCRTAAGVSQVVVLVSDPRNRDAFPTGVETICATAVLTAAMTDAVWRVGRRSEAPETEASQPET